jgi:ribonuclease HII
VRRAVVPHLREEKALRTEGYGFIAGIDEAGRGALMGPVVAAAVILPPRLRGSWRSRVRDSKLLTPARRDALYEEITGAAIAWGVGSASSEDIDAVGIAPATRRAMLAAVAALQQAPDYLLIDYFKLPETPLPQRGIVHGDAVCFSIACASIIAKVTRDRWVTDLDTAYPGYGFADHKGYGTEDHLACLRRLGPCPVHRRSFHPVRALMGQDGTA